MDKSEYCKRLESLNLLTLGPTLIKDAYSIDVVQQKISIRYYNEALIDLELINARHDQLTYKYAGWKIYMRTVRPY